ncbi:MAG: FtsH protease activity modulator HflK [Gammaproteobacteria bacterium]|nr:FtsH protease activity modulator HflK [Gammaproteobacteria bacterium]
MAWNEPGKPGQDPWGGNRPPRKDSSADAVEQVKRQLEAFLGKIGQQSGGQNGSSAMPPEGLGVGMGVVAGAAVAIWLAFGTYIIDPAERGVVTVFGAFTQETGPGPHWNWPTPIGDVTKVNVEQIRNAEIGYRSVKNTNSDVAGESLMLTQDENIVDIKLAVQYNIRNASNYLFNNVDPDNALREIVESALRDVVGKNKMDFVLTDGRAQLVAKVRDSAQEALDSLKAGIQITSVNLQDAQPPEQVQASFADVVKAREDRQRLISEAEAYANDILPKARGQAARLTEEANAYREQVVSRAEGEASRFNSILTQYQKAPEVTRQRMYLDTVEQVLGASSKIMVSAKSSGQMMYLPLDKWMQGDKSGLPATPTMNALPDTSASSSVRTAPSLRDNLRNREAR